MGAPAGLAGMTEDPETGEPTPQVPWTRRAVGAAGGLGSSDIGDEAGGVHYAYIEGGI